MKYLLEILDTLDAQERHEIMYGSFMAVIESVETAQGVQRKEAVNYEAFKKVCMSLPSGIGTLLVISAMHLALSMLFNSSDTTSVEENKTELVGFAELVMRTPPPPEQAD